MSVFDNTVMCSPFKAGCRNLYSRVPRSWDTGLSLSGVRHHTFSSPLRTLCVDVSPTCPLLDKSTAAYYRTMGE